MRSVQLMVTASLLTIAATACGGTSGDASKTPSSASPSPSAPTSSSPTTALVGEWQRTQSCQELVGVLTAYGLKQQILSSIAGDDWIPGVGEPAQIEDPAHPCRGAAPRKHSHFFTADGQFGSRDAGGQQVDDGAYQVTGADTVVIGEDEFHFTITGDTLQLQPTLPACAPACEEARWTVSVAYPGYTWHRVD